MAISMTKLSSADYYLDRTREALQADGAIPDEATPGPLTGPDPAAYYNAEGNPPGRWIGSVFCFNVCSTGSAVFFRSVG